MADLQATGLSASEVAAQRALHGFNDMPVTGRRSVWHIAFNVVREPMFLLLLTAGGIYMLLGDAADALLLLGFVVITMGMTIFEERRTEGVLESLRALSSPQAWVLRGGERQQIPGRELVCGDLLILEEGERISADGVLLEAHDLAIDESQLTGESVAVSKQTGAAGAECSLIFAGSLIVQGGGVARVSAIGGATEMGKIGHSLASLESESSPLQDEIARLVRQFALFGSLLALSVFGLYGWLRHDWLQAMLTSISLAMSMMPEEFTVILTVFMALGAWRISRQQVLTRHAPVIEALGSTTVLCVDKTGTLTENRMRVQAVVVGSAVLVVDERLTASSWARLYPLLHCAVLASETRPFDAMDIAFHQCLLAHYPVDQGVPSTWAMVHEYPLTGAVQAMTHVWATGTDGGHIVATKGAPESVARLCRLDAAATARMLTQVQQLASQGMRVLAVAQATLQADANHQSAPPVWPTDPAAFDFVFLGLVGLADPLRAEVADCVAQCQQAGIRVVMITGDYPATAQAIARQAGIPSDRVLSGAQLAAMPAQELTLAVAQCAVFARVRPEQKLLLVQAMKARGEVVAMTGDGVNDAPALKAAHIGIAMGQRGTDVAREAASLVLLRDDFSAILAAIALGRRIYDNLRKALSYVVAVHLPIAGMSLLPLLFGLPMALSPIHIVFLEMVINPACAIVFETERAEQDVLLRPPRSVDERLFGAGKVGFAIWQGMGMLSAVATVFVLSLHGGASEEQARGLAFAVVVLGNLLLIICSRSLQQPVWVILRQPNRAQWWIIGGALLALMASLGVPALQNAFHFATLAPDMWIAPVLAACFILLWLEISKWCFRLLQRPVRAASAAQAPGST